MGDDGEGLGDGGQAPAVTPRISIVLPVFNGAERLHATLTSILDQTESDYELIVVDDGSSDATPSILAEFAAGEARMRIISQPNGGLTQALIRGCAAARAPVIARHDCGDVSHPDRLRRMDHVLQERPSCVLVGCEVAYSGPQGETLYKTDHARKDLRAALLHAGVGDIVSLPAGAAALMRADAYHAAGGFRAEFYFAQDLDLWIRMAAQGDIAVVGDVLYEARVDVASISSLHRAEQVACATIAIAVRDAATIEQRSELLEEAARIRPRGHSAPRSLEARALHFIAACLQKQNDPRWRGYASRAVRRQPLAVRSWLLLLRGMIL